MKAQELIKQIQENMLDGTEDFEVAAHVGETGNSKEFKIEFTFWHEGKLYLAIKEVNT